MTASLANTSDQNTSGVRRPNWRAFTESRYLMGGAYVLAVILTVAGSILAASPPASGPLGPASEVVMIILGVNLVLVLALTALFGLRVLKLIEAARGDAGARLHRRFVALFSLAALAPALVVALFYGVLVTRGVEEWFSSRVRTVVENSRTVANSYVEEQTVYIRDHAFQVAGDLNRYAEEFQAKPITLGHALSQLASYHGFPAAYILDRDGRILARAEVADPPSFLAPPPSNFVAADEGDISVRPFESADLIRALYKLKAYPDAYLYVVRPVDKGILNHLRETEASLIAYRDAGERRGRIQAAFALSYVETAFLVLVGAVWLGIAAANSIATPVARLVQAAGRVSAGDLSARVEIGNEPEELAVLSRAFNSMTNDIQVQQAALTAASLDAESRRQFIETVLLGVSAGVLGLDANGRISASNRQASLLLGLDPEDTDGRLLEDLAPELAEVAREAVESHGEVEAEVDVTRTAEARRLRVRASVARDDGLVLTFDDITRLVAAQRNAAWKDVARRIAHEIKNPLTPIQLSAERIRRKYRGEIHSDLETFDRCTETIIRQVGDIGRMVDEFSAFARMPAPRMADFDPVELLRQSVFAQRVASPELTVDLVEPSEDLVFSGDERMLGQALANVLKNAAEAVAARHGKSGEGHIQTRLLLQGGGMVIEIEDNGVGLPVRDRDRLTEPYITTREKGTGLGLAIVKRILEDHGGELVLADASQLPGAKVTFRLPHVRVVHDPLPGSEEVKHGV